jgi:hypothetical protein
MNHRGFPCGHQALGKVRAEFEAGLEALRRSRVVALGFSVGDDGIATVK